MHPPPMITTSALRRNLFDLFPHWRTVAAVVFFDLALGVAVLRHLVGNLRPLPRVPQAGRHRGAVEIRPEAGVVGAGDLHGVSDVLGDLPPPYKWEEGPSELPPHI